MKAEFHLFYSDEAITDLISINRYIEEDLCAPIAAKNQIFRIREGIRNLCFFPQKHPLVTWEPGKAEGIHQLPIDHYIIFYQYEENTCTINIVRIMYGGRNIPKIIAKKNNT